MSGLLRTDTAGRYERPHGELGTIRLAVCVCRPKRRFGRVFRALSYLFGGLAARPLGGARDDLAAHVAARADRAGGGVLHAFELAPLEYAICVGLHLQRERSAVVQVLDLHVARSPVVRGERKPNVAEALQLRSDVQRTAERVLHRVERVRYAELFCRDRHELAQTTRTDG